MTTQKIGYARVSTLDQNLDRQLDMPNKAISYETSLLSKLPTILRILKAGKISPGTLYQKTQGEFADINQFLLAMDALFILEKIEFENGDLKLC